MERFKQNTQAEESAPSPKKIEMVPGIDVAGSEKVRQHLQEIDLPVLQGIFSEIWQKAGADPGSLNLIPPEQITITHESQAAGGTSSEALNIAANSDSFYDTLWTYIHENLHVIAADPDQIDTDGQFIKTGYYEKTNVTESGSTPRFKNINEGVTELITEQIYREYLRRSGQKSNDNNADLNVVFMALHRGFNPKYALYRQRALFYIQVVASLAEVPFATAKDALIRGYLRNGTLVPSELAELTPTRFPNNFFTQEPHILHHLEHLLNQMPPREGENPYGEIEKFTDSLIFSGGVPEEQVIAIEQAFEELKVESNIILEEMERRETRRKSENGEAQSD